MIEELLQPVGDEKPAEAIYTQIKQHIIEGTIATGSRLPSERKMMELFGRSRSTIREALRLLERDGYITTVSRSSGAIVKEPGVESVVDSLETMIQMQNLDIENVLEFRLLTETAAAQMAALRRNGAQIGQLEAIMEKTAGAIGDAKRFSECDFEFHMAVAQAAGNELYCIMLTVCRKVVGERLIEVLQKGTEKERNARYQSILEKHNLVCRAIEQMKPDMAYHYMRNHLNDASDDILDL